MPLPIKKRRRRGIQSDWLLYLNDLRRMRELRRQYQLSSPRLKEPKADGNLALDKEPKTQNKGADGTDYNSSTNTSADAKPLVKDAMLPNANSASHKASSVKWIGSYSATHEPTVMSFVQVNNSLVQQSNRHLPAVVRAIHRVHPSFASQVNPRRKHLFNPLSLNVICPLLTNQAVARPTILEYSLDKTAR